MSPVAIMAIGVTITLVVAILSARAIIAIGARLCQRSEDEVSNDDQ